MQFSACKQNQSQPAVWIIISFYKNTVQLPWCWIVSDMTVCWQAFLNCLQVNNYFLSLKASSGFSFIYLFIFFNFFEVEVSNKSYLIFWQCVVKKVCMYYSLW